MLTIWGSKQRFCEGVSRRDFLKVGALGSALSLPDVLRLKSQGASKSSQKSVIMVCLNGGPSHIDMYDLKPEAPSEIRGEFDPIHTNVPGFDICEHLPLQASIADKLAVVRNVQWPLDDGHRLHLLFTGFPASAGRPSFGGVVSRLRRDRNNALPPYVSMAQFPPHPILHSHEEPTYLGTPHRPFVPFQAGPLENGKITYTGPGMGSVKNLELLADMTRQRLGERSTLLSSFDNLRHEIDSSGEMAGKDAFTVRALEMISSNQVRDAFDISREPASVQAKYGGDIQCKNDPDKRRCWEGSKFLLARRLVEAGVPVVTLSAGVWDTHVDHFTYQRDYLPRLDQSLHALITDLHERGMSQDVTVVVCGEMGRTPRINKNAGRDHWPSAGFALFSGGGLNMGQVIGATDDQGARPKNLAYNPQNILATLYHVLGVNTEATFPDHAGRPRYILDDRESIAELT